jgi:MFS transporter, DHA2 family, multidrug resistance protein
VSDAADIIENPLHGWQLFAVAFCLALANFVVVLDLTIANVSIPHIAGSLAVSPTQGTWAITSYSVADAITVPLTGWLAARFGSVRWFLASLVGFATFSFLCGLSRTLDALIVFRILQGLSGGPLLPLSQVLLLRIFPRDKQPMALALWAMTTTSAPIVGPILGGTISDNWSWPWIFFINLPIVAICFVSVRALALRYDTPRIKKRIDVVGLILLVLTVGAFQLMLDTGRENDWFESRWIVGLAVVSAIAFAIFIVWELTDANPVVDIRVFRHRGFAAGTLAISLAFGSYFASIVLAPLWLQQVMGYSATVAGHVVAWAGVLAVVCAPIAARGLGRIDLRVMASVGIGWVAFVSTFRLGWTTDSDYWTFALPQLVQGAGMPLFFMGLTQLALASVNPEETTSAAGLMSFTRTLSGAIATALATTAWDSGSRLARSDLTGHMNGANDVMARLQANGMTEIQARAVIDRLVDVQGQTIGMLHVFVLATCALTLAAAAVWLAPKPTRRASLSGGH